MKPKPKLITILIADDDPTTATWLRMLREARLMNDIRFVRDGEELLDSSLTGAGRTPGRTLLAR